MVYMVVLVLVFRFLPLLFLPFLPRFTLVTRGRFSTPLRLAGRTRCG